MEKLSIEEKAKAYDKALKVLHKYDGANIMFSQSLKEEMFPELKQNEDERISEEIINYLSTVEDKELIPYKIWIAWIKKQAEKKVNPYSGTSFVYNNHTWGMCARDGGIDILCDSKLIKHIEQGKTIFEKLSEQMPTDKIQLGKEYKCITSPRYTMFLTGDIYKAEDRFLCSLMNLCSDCFEPIEDSEQNDFTSNANKAEPKFKVGDIILCKHDDRMFAIKEVDLKKGVYIYTEKGCGDDINYTDEMFELVEPKFKVGDWIITPENKVLQITSIKDTSYKFNNKSHYWEVYYCDKRCRLWSIADAKDGDVLMGEDDYPFIYTDNHIYTKYLTAYCGITNDGAFKISDKTELWTNDNVEPASKEQRDLLFAKMREAGYEWDGEKKELKKIE